MPWTLHFEQDTEIPGVGTVTATSDSGARHSGRVDTNTGKGIDDFVAECREIEQRALKMRGDANAVIEKIAAVLNAEAIKA